MGVGGSETCYTTISLIEFADEFISQEDIKFAKAQLNKNQNKISLIQKQINPIKYYNKIAKDTLKDNNIEEENRGADNDSDDNQRTESKFGINMAGGLRIKELGVLNANGEPRDSEIN